MGSKQGAGEMNRIMAGMKNTDQTNFFKKLYEKGQSITFDHNGIPMIQKKGIPQEQETLDYTISKKLIIETAAQKWAT